DVNGYISLVSNADTGVNQSVPATTTPNGELAVFWDDLAGNAFVTGVDPKSAVCVQQFNPDGIVGNADDYTLISWENLRHNGSPNSAVNFQIKFYETTGNFEYQYGSMTSDNGTFSNGAEATVWFEALDGTNALSVSVNKPVISSATGYRFTYT